MAPEERELPLAIFDQAKQTIAPGTWDNPGALEVARYSLDADQDGRPEQIRYYDRESEALLRVELDRDYNGKLDAWQDYEAGALVRRTLDEDGDGKPDTWETYANGRMASREVDRNRDGKRDAFYNYQADSLVQEQHDGDGDGKVDLVIKYENRVRTALEEDRDHDARMDQWTRYEVRGDKELPDRSSATRTETAARTCSRSTTRRAARPCCHAARRTRTATARSTSRRSTRRASSSSARSTTRRWCLCRRILAPGLDRELLALMLAEALDVVPLDEHHEFLVAVADPRELERELALRHPRRGEVELDVDAPLVPSLVSAVTRTWFLPSRTGTNPEKLPSGRRFTSVDTSFVVRLVSTTSSTFANEVPWRNDTMSPGFCTAGTCRA
jgi:hypothetical protein